MPVIIWFAAGAVIGAATAILVIVLLYRWAEHEAFKMFWGP